MSDGKIDETITRDLIRRVVEQDESEFKGSPYLLVHQSRLFELLDALDQARSVAVRARTEAYESHEQSREDERLLMAWKKGGAR